MAGDPSAPVEVVLEGHPCGVVQRQQAALLELGFPNDEPIRCQVAQLECPGFRGTHACGCKQAKQRAVGIGPQGARRPESTRIGHHALDFLAAEDIGGWALAPTTEDPCWWEFMTQ